MKVRPRCRTCLLEQSARTFDVLQIQGKTRSTNLKAIKKFIDEKFTEDRITAELGTEVHRELKRITNNDPFKEEKERSNRAALRLVDRARALIENTGEPLCQSFKIAIAGNLIDFGTYYFDVDSSEKELVAALSDEFVIDDFDRIKGLIEGAKRILYLCDNAGEIVFDRLCIEEIQKLGPDVTAVVKSGPIVNDATMQDARAAGLDEVCNVIESGTDSVGVILGESSAEFLKELKSADLIIAKGQGHFETMEDMELPVAFLLKAKCKTVASALGVKLKSSVVMLGHSRR
ncbi:MAG: ARMT1-like domain-containing protein [Candidatus Hydrothermarchaeaceae archaeon]